MKPSLHKLQKILKLEAERGYDNHAVLGGFERFMDHWEAEARLDGLAEDLIQVIAGRLRDYPRLATASRTEVLDGLWRRLQKVDESFARTSLAPEKVEGHPAAEAQPSPGVTAKPAGEGDRENSTVADSGEAAVVDAVESVTPAPGVQDPGRLKETAQSVSQTAAFQPEEGTARVEIAAAPDRPSPPGPAPASSPPAYSGPPAALNAPTTVLPGVGPKHAETLARLGIHSLHDMLYYLPRRYDDYSQLKPINRLWYGEVVTVIATIQSINVRPLRGGSMHIVEAIISDGTGALRINWFNQIHYAKRLRPGMHVSVSGKIDQYLGRLVMSNPELEQLEQQQLSTNRIVPVYPLTGQITPRWLRKLINQVVTYWAPRVQDPLPPAVRRSAGLVDLPAALLQVHFPDSWEALKAARKRLAFDEIFLLQMGVMGQKRLWQEQNARGFAAADDWLETQQRRLPFSLTGAQRHAMEDILHDLASGRPMNRLLQGDVGSGKTVIAGLAVGLVASHGAQSAFMAPTSILAEQHYRSLLRLLSEEIVPAGIPASLPSAQEGETEADTQESPQEEAVSQPVPPLLRPDEIRLMVGATPEAEKREIRQGLADGSLKLVIGTHALIEDPVVFSDLQLVIIDEQHRFGVDQRAALRSKGQNPHLLVMTATPIPRSLALTVYGDLDLTLIDEMPPGRQPVGTHVLAPRELERAYSLIRSEVSKGRQAFVIYPLIEESDKSDAKAAVDEHARLQQEIFPRLKVGLLHGRMKPEEKDSVMERFRSGEYHILVSTTVVEVGVDIPNATVMLVEGANHFGLAQLHQLRGRVGRGSDKAYCLLVPDTTDALENERLQVMSETNDGFVLAERDLEQRGPGQFLGTRQSGYSELQLASLTDVRLIESARQQAQAVFAKDPQLEQPEHQALADAVRRFWGGGRGDIS